MASSYKTPYINLNSFVGTDKPKMDDFNYDNKAIDNAMKNHAEDVGIHVSAAEKTLWNGGAFIMGTYTGDNNSKREINIGFKPRLCLIFQEGMPIVSYDNQSGINVRSALVSVSGSTQFANLTENGFFVENVNTSAPYGASPKLNLDTQKYVYIAYK